MRGGRQTSAITRNHLLADVRQQLRYFGRYCRALVLIALGFFAQSFPSIIGAMENFHRKSSFHLSSLSQHQRQRDENTSDQKLRTSSHRWQ
jgi:hypothetical protein